MGSKIIKKCSCGRSLRLEDTQYIGCQKGQKKVDGKIIDIRLHLFNCRFCRTTLVIKGVK